MEKRGPIADLIHEFSRLPGIGRKTAQRLTYHILDAKEEEVRALAHALIEARTKTHLCHECFNYADEDPCPICSNQKRDQRKILVVEQPRDLNAIEKTGQYHGLYHVLHGAISPAEGIGPENLRIAELLRRLQRHEVDEVILAMNPTHNGETTSLYLGNLLKASGISVTRISYGIPFGGDLEYYDEFTLTSALKNRVRFGE